MSAIDLLAEYQFEADRIAMNVRFGSKGDQSTTPKKGPLCARKRTLILANQYLRF
jgi:hypothetical protein